MAPLQEGQRLFLGRPDGGDGDAGVPTTTAVVSPGDSCTSVTRIIPGALLLPDTDYFVTLFSEDGGAVTARFGGVPAAPFFFHTGAGPDFDPPPPPTLDKLSYSEASCDSCGSNLGGGVGVSFQPGEQAWVAPIESRFPTNGGSNGFFLHFACGQLVSGLPEGEHEMSVIAFDRAWNQSGISKVTLTSTCNGLDPCTGERVTRDPPRLPLGGGGCGCASVPTLASLLAALAMLRVLSRRR